jgi:hypothetical protein
VMFEELERFVADHRRCDELNRARCKKEATPFGLRARVAPSSSGMSRLRWPIMICSVRGSSRFRTRPP